jgi:hypothetical protein
MTLAAPEDVADAIEHLEEYFELPAQFIEPEMFEFHDDSDFDYLTTKDDFSSWPEWSEGELQGLGEEELRGELEGFRGTGFADAVFEWLEMEEWPPIVVIKSPYFYEIADGRGRVSVAIGLGIDTLPATVLNVIDEGLLEAMRESL